MKRFLQKLLPYVKGLWSSLGKLRPNVFLRAIAHADEVIKPIDQYKFSIILNINDRVISRPILLKNNYEENVTKTLLKYLKPDLHFLDIGANIGYYSLLVASQCPAAKIYSFEPDSNNFRLFKTSIHYNGFDDRIQAHQLAVSDTTETILLFDVGTTTNSGAKITAPDKDSFTPFIHTDQPDLQTVQAVRLDDFLVGTPIDLLKIDIEGHEPFAIRGMAELIRHNRPVILAELAPLSLSLIGRTTPADFLQFFLDLNYQISVISDDATLIPCGQNVGQVMAYFDQKRTNHIDLLLELRCPIK